MNNLSHLFSAANLKAFADWAGNLSLQKLFIVVDFKATHLLFWIYNESINGQMALNKEFSLSMEGSLDLGAIPEGKSSSSTHISPVAQLT